MNFTLSYHKDLEKITVKITILTCSKTFDHIELIGWPDSLTTLTFGNMFNQPIKNVKWPESLTILTFG